MNREEEEDAGELARYHALNNDKDEMLYRDNPDYREAYDSIKESSMRLAKSKLRRILRQSIVETYDGEGRPNWDNEEKLRKAGKFDKSNISKADEEQTAAELKYREDLRKDYERKLAEIEKMKQDRNARKKGERYRFDESSLRRTIRKIIAEYGRRHIIKESLSRFGDVQNFLQTVIWPCYQSGLSERECYRQALGTEEMQFLRKHKEDILLVNDNPEFIAYAYEIACMV